VPAELGDKSRVPQPPPIDVTTLAHHGHRRRGWIVARGRSLYVDLLLNDAVITLGKEPASFSQTTIDSSSHKYRLL